MLVIDEDTNQDVLEEKCICLLGFTEKDFNQKDKTFRIHFSTIINSSLPLVHNCLPRGVFYSSKELTQSSQLCGDDLDSDMESVVRILLIWSKLF